MKFPFILGPVFLMAWHPLAGSPGPAAQLKSGTTLRVDVDLVTVEAIVLDKKGVPVRNLKKENFQLFEDGKEQVISTFDEVSADPSQAATGSPDDTDGAGPNRGKVVLILFDDSHLTAGRFEMTRDSAEKYVKQHMGPRDLFAVASYSVSLKILQNFTLDAARVLVAIRQPGGSAELPAGTSSTSTNAAGRDSRRLGMPLPEGQTNTIANYQTATYRAIPFLQTLDSLNSSLAQVKGRKAVLLYSEEFSASTNSHNEFMKAVNSARKADVAFYTIDAKGLNSLEGGGGGQGVGPQGGGIVDYTRARQSRGSDIDWNQFEKLPMDNILRLLAVETDGQAIFNSSDFNPTPAAK
jgi:VWFA-related protein